MATKKKSTDSASTEDNNGKVFKEAKKSALFKQLTKSEDLKDTFVLTDNVAFDIAMSNGRGLPVGVFVMIASPKGTGKSTLSCDLIKRLLDKHKKSGIPYQAVYIDIEGSKSLANNFGLGEYIDSGNLLHSTGTTTYSDLEDFYKNIINGDEEVKDVKLIIIDSIANVTTGKMIDKGVEEAHFGITAKAATEFFTKITPYCARYGITTIMINHEKVDQEAGKDFTGKTAKKEAGSDAAKYFSAAILRLSKKTGANNDGIEKHSIKTMQGVVQKTEKFKVTIKSPDKNRFCNIGEVEMLVKPGKRIVDEYPIKNILINSGLVTKTGGWYAVCDDLLIEEERGKKKSTKDFNTYLSKNLEFLREYLRNNNLYRWDLENNEDFDPDGYVD